MASKKQHDDLLRLDTIGGKIIANPAGKKFDYREIPKRLEAIGWERDKALEEEGIAYDHTRIYKKIFKSSKVNDEATTVIAMVSDCKTTFKKCHGLGVISVEVLSFEGRAPYDRTDLKDMLYAIDLAIFDLYHEGQVPFVHGFKFHGNRSIHIWNRTRDQIWSNWHHRRDLRLLETEREFFLEVAKKELPANIAQSIMERNYPDEPEPKY
ncbi:hypothetical protein IKG06_04045 [Candidatus Saccharibacteria bacterium]|nr:hypothetical protein [Candidatus Saccharibacteria bacterium]